MKITYTTPRDVTLTYNPAPPRTAALCLSLRRELLLQRDTKITRWPCHVTGETPRKISY